MKLFGYFSEGAFAELRRPHRAGEGDKGHPGGLRLSGVAAGDQRGSARASQVMQMLMFWWWSRVPGVYCQWEKLPSGDACLRCISLESRWPA